MPKKSTFFQQLLFSHKSPCRKCSTREWGESLEPKLTVTLSRSSSMHMTQMSWCSQSFDVFFGHSSYFQMYFHTLFRVVSGFFSPHSIMCLLIMSHSTDSFFWDCFTLECMTVRDSHPYTTWVSASGGSALGRRVNIRLLPSYTRHQDTVRHSHLLWSSTTSRSVSPPWPWRRRSEVHLRKHGCL